MPLDSPNKDTGNMLIQNPYYEGSNEVSGLVAIKSSFIPDLNDTEIITKTQNVYYEIQTEILCIM